MHGVMVLSRHQEAHAPLLSARGQAVMSSPRQTIESSEQGRHICCDCIFFFSPVASHPYSGMFLHTQPQTNDLLSSSKPWKKRKRKKGNYENYVCGTIIYKTKLIICLTLFWDIATTLYLDKEWFFFPLGGYVSFSAIFTCFSHVVLVLMSHSCAASFGCW